MARFYTTEKIGQTLSLTPEGFLLCEGVPVARTGEMVYGPDEVPVEPGPDGVIRIRRDEDAVFDATFLASLNGKPVVNDHPDDDVTPENWNELAVGVGMNPRRGTGMQDDLVVMDLLITQKAAIKDVQSGKKEISLGYDADYEETGRGTGRQDHLIGNHIALVDQGRCGLRCSIGDRKTVSTGDQDMQTRDKKFKKSRVSDALSLLLKALRTKDEAAIEAAKKEAEQVHDDGEPSGGAEGDTHVHVHAGGEGSPSKFTDEDHEEYWKKNDEEHQQFRDELAALRQMIEEKGAGSTSHDEENKEIEGALREEAPPGTGDAAVKARDSAYLGDSFQEAIAMAEILVPGIRVPTYDRALKPGQTLDSICRLRRTALDLAYAAPDTRAIIDDINGGRALELGGMKCSEVRALFRSAATAKKAANNRTNDTGRGRDHSAAGRPVNDRTTADVNKRNAEFWKNKV